MRRLSRYIFAECAVAALIALMVLTSLVLLPQILKLVDLWVNKDVSFGVLAAMTLLIIPKFLVASLPMGLLIGVLMGLGRLSQDSETAVMKASGVSLYQMARPISVLIILAVILSLWLNWRWAPYSHERFTQLKTALLTNTTLSVKTGAFNRAIPGLTLYIHEQSQGGRLFTGLLIHDQRNPDEPLTLIARQGQLHTNSAGGAALYLTDGSRQQRLPNGGFRQLDFATYDLDLGLAADAAAGGGERKLSTYSAAGLAAAMAGEDPQKAYEARLEWHRRLAIPGATLILGFLAIPLGLQQSQRTGRGFGFIVAVLTLVLHFLLLTFGEAMAQKRAVDPLIGFWTPNALMGIFTLYITFMTGRDRSFGPIEKLSQFLWSLSRRRAPRPPSPPAGPGGV